MNKDNFGLRTSDFGLQKKLNIYFTAGIPNLEDTGKIAKLIQDSGADMMEIGIPYSDPVADGPVIQEGHVLALQNGMTIKKLFERFSFQPGKNFVVAHEALRIFPQKTSEW